MRRRYTEKITYWAPGAENLFGEETLAQPVVLDGRWEDRVEKVVTPSGETLVAKALVFSGVHLAVDGFVQRGAHTGDPGPEAARIQGTTEVRSLRTNNVTRMAVL